MNSDFELTANAMPTAPGRVRDPAFRWT